MERFNHHCVSLDEFPRRVNMSEHARNLIVTNMDAAIVLGVSAGGGLDARRAGVVHTPDIELIRNLPPLV
jgi:hypothetical protein